MATVNDLIEHLRTFPQELPVAYRLHSEQCLLELTDIQIDECCHPRQDGWIQDKRPDMPSMTYLVFPGN